MKILVLTSTYPCFPGDSQPGFIKEFCENLALAGHEVSVLAPHGPKVVDEEVDPIDVTRFRYFFSPFESLAYGSGVLENLKQNPIKFALIPFFIFGMCWGLIRLDRSIMSPLTGVMACFRPNHHLKQDQSIESLKRSASWRAALWCSCTMASAISL